jgi:hypothetical protein
MKKLSLYKCCADCVAELDYDDDGNYVSIDDYEEAEAQNKELANREFEIDFGNHLKAMLIIDEGEIKVTAAVNGWGASVPLDEIKLLEK